MATIASRRADLTAALATAGVKVSDAPGRLAPPVAIVNGDGSDCRGVGRGQIRMGWRLTLVVGSPDASGQSAKLGTLIGATLGGVRTLSGWEVGELRPDRIVTIAGGEHLAADLIVSAMVDL